jgi:hypothetical protein
MPADGQERQAGDGPFSMSADVQRQDRRKIVQHALRCKKARQEMDHAAFWQMDRGRAGDGSCSMLADGQRQGRRWIMQHAGRWTLDRGRAAEGSYSMPADGQGQGSR